MSDEKLWEKMSLLLQAKSQVQQNQIIKVLHKAPTFRVELAPIYNQFSILKLD